MQRRVNPMIDSVFKALFANPAHSHLLADLLNSVVEPDVPIVEVEYIDPVDEPDRLLGRRTVVDVKVKDARGHIYQVEVQVVLHQAMAERMLLTWARLYDRQFLRGQDYTDLLPVTSVWILDRRMRADGKVHRRYAVRERDGQLLSEHCHIHVLDLGNVGDGQPATPLEDWLYFLKNARRWGTLPATVDRNILQEAMHIMREFTEDDRQYFRYLRELDAETIELTRKRSTREGLEALEKLKGVEQALSEKEAALSEKDAALSEKDAVISEKDAAISEKDAVISEKDAAISEKDAIIARMVTLLAANPSGPTG